jgi:hypothetical protein
MSLPNAALIGGLAVDVKIFTDDADASRCCGETGKGEAQKKDGFHRISGGVVASITCLYHYCPKPSRINQDTNHQSA